MIVIAHQPTQTSHAGFERMLPKIREQARHAFRAARPELKEELIAETIANAFCAFVRLVERGKEDITYATPLAGYAIRQVCAGRCVGTKLNVRDVSSRHAQRTKGISVERLDQFDAAEGEWREALVEDRKAGPAETAAARIDVAAWFRSLARKKRRIAQMLARGEGTGKVAGMFGLTAGRVSQLRRELAESWEEFHGEPAVA
jgi:hypothetical protein